MCAQLVAPLLHERDLYLAWSLKRSKAVQGTERVVGVVGRGHMRGVLYALTHPSASQGLRFRCGRRAVPATQLLGPPSYLLTSASCSGAVLQQVSNSPAAVPRPQVARSAGPKTSGLSEAPWLLLLAQGSGVRQERGARAAEGSPRGGQAAPAGAGAGRRHVCCLVAAVPLRPSSWAGYSIGWCTTRKMDACSCLCGVNHTIAACMQCRQSAMALQPAAALTCASSTQLLLGVVQPYN